MVSFAAILDDRTLGSGLDQIFSDLEGDISSDELAEQVNIYKGPDYEKGEITSAMDKLRRGNYVEGGIEDGEYRWRRGPRFE